MSIVYVDTNIYLNFYRGYGSSLELIKGLKKLGKKLVLTQQTLNEFERNRAKALAQAIAALAVYEFKAVQLPSGLMSAVSEFKELEKSRANVKQSVKKLQETLQKYIDDETTDPVFTEFQELQKSAVVLPTTKENVEKAHHRLLLGTPPMSRDKGTACDELIWETLLHGCSEDLVVCSEDGAFALYEAFLRVEYKRETGKGLSLVSELSAALKAAGVDETAAKRAEEQAAERQKADKNERAAAFEGAQRAVQHLSPTWISLNSPYVTLNDMATINDLVAADPTTITVTNVPGSLGTLGTLQDGFKSMVGPVTALNDAYKGIVTNVPVTAFQSAYTNMLGSLPLNEISTAVTQAQKVAATIASVSGPAVKAIRDAQKAVAASPALQAIQGAQKAIATSPAVEAVKGVQSTVAKIAAASGPAAKAVQQAARAVAENPGLRAVHEAARRVDAAPSKRNMTERRKDIPTAPSSEHQPKGSGMTAKKRGKKKSR